jgi:hypothetical protein
VSVFLEAQLLKGHYQKKDSIARLRICFSPELKKLDVFSLALLHKQDALNNPKALEGVEYLYLYNAKKYGIQGYY